MALTRGRRTPPTGKPANFSASFTRMGFAVLNSPSMRGMRRSLAAAASSHLPAAHNSTITFIRAGATFPMVEMTPHATQFHNVIGCRIVAGVYAEALRRAFHNGLSPDSKLPEPP